jgi:acetyltransferase-like isoleucine patch superfamily enzyme
MTSSENYKFKDFQPVSGSSAFRRYRQLTYGNMSLWRVAQAELIITLTSGIAGGLGLALRKWLYPKLFRTCGKGVIFGRNLTLRHPHKVDLGDGVILDDHVVLDAKGESNDGIRIGDRVFIGRNTILYCKNGDIKIEHQANISSNCQIFSSNLVQIGAGTMLAAFTYILSGGSYDLANRDIPFAEQSGTESKGPTLIGANCWLAAGVIIVDGVTLGDHVVAAAGSVILSDIYADTLCAGTPAKAIRSI